MKRKKGRFRQAFARFLMSVPFLRRQYVKRVLALIEEGGVGSKPLPPELQQLRRMLKQVPPPKRLDALESALRYGMTEQAQQPPPSRALRRAAARQQRKMR